MSRDKQVDEMGTIIATKAFEQAHLENGDDNLADIVATDLYNAGYRKSTDIAEEIFAEIESKKIFLKDLAGNIGIFVRLKDIAELKKKYTEEGK